MNDRKIVYDSNEISNIVSRINNNTSIVETDIISSLNNDFSILRELDLFNEGLSKLNKTARDIVSLNNKIDYILDNHDSNMNELNNKHIALFNDFDNNEEEVNAYNGVVVDINEIKLKKTTDGKLVLKEYINSVVFKFNYDKKLELLKKILNNNSLSIITDKEQSDVLIYQLKNILKDEYSINELSKLTKEEELEIQKDFFKAISNNDKNIFNEIEDDSILKGIASIKESCDDKNILIEDLLYDDNNNELFINIIKDIYKSDKVNESILFIKEYVNKLAKDANLEPLELLNVNYSSVLKGGIYYES